MTEHSEALLRLVPAAELTDLSYYDLRASRVASLRENSAGTVGGEDVEIEPSYGLALDRNPEEGDRFRFRIRLRIELRPPGGEIVAEAGAEYVVNETMVTSELTPNLLVEYANQVGVMTLLPYLRQAIADLTQRVFGAALLMPVLPRGSVTFPYPDSEVPDAEGVVD